MPAAISVSDLRKTYRSRVKGGGVTAVDGLSLEIERGEIFGLLGSNGAGKTTTIKIIAGLVVQDAGSVGFPAFGRRPQLGAVLEGSRNLYWRMSPWENIRYFGELRGIPVRELRRQCDELLALFGLADRRDRPAQTLSRGMQQKLAVVLALLGEPEVLLLDEPTLGLDVESSLTIRELLARLCSERRITMVLTTHQMDVAQSLCQRVGIVHAGKLAYSSRVDALVDEFRRQDYVARMSAADWRSAGPELTGYSFELLPEQRPEQVSVRFKLDSPVELYALMDKLAAAQSELLDFHQEQPTLEDVFLHITRKKAGGHQ